MPTGKLGTVNRLVNTTGGTPSATFTVVDVPASYTEATLAAQLATIVVAIQQIQDAMAKFGMVDR